MVFRRKRRTFRSLGLVYVVVCAQSLQAADEAYRRALAIEAEKVVSGNSENAPSSLDSGDATTESWRLFEQDLKKHYVSTFQLYEKLPIKSRRQVFEIYQSDKNVDRVRREVVERLLNP